MSENTAIIKIATATTRELNLGDIVNKPLASSKVWSNYTKSYRTIKTPFSVTFVGSKENLDLIKQKSKYKKSEIKERAIAAFLSPKDYVIELNGRWYRKVKVLPIYYRIYNYIANLLK